MSIETELEELAENLASAKNAVVAKGGTVGDTGFSGLASEIESVPAGGSEYDIADPDKVYESTRPADWLGMPEPEANTVYILYQVNENIPMDKIYTFQIGGTGTRTVSFGTVINGQFVADPDLVYPVTVDRYTYGQYAVPFNKFHTSTAEGKVQIMAKITSTSSMTYVTLGADFPNSQMDAVEIMANTASGRVDGFTYAYQLKYFTQTNRQGASASLALFRGLPLLTVVRTNFSGSTSLAETFKNCVSLQAVSEIDAANCTSYQETFAGCTSLVRAPKINTNSATTLSGMFDGCKVLSTVPELTNTSKCANFNSMFNNCASLKNLDFSKYSYAAAIATTNNQRWYQFAGKATGDTTITFGSFPNNAFAMPAGSSAVTSHGSGSYGDTANTPVRIIMTQPAKVILQGDATGYFGTDSYNRNAYVYVPDNLLVEYQADAHWATLGTRLKAMSELPWYVSESEPDSEADTTVPVAPVIEPLD